MLEREVKCRGSGVESDGRSFDALRFGWETSLRLDHQSSPVIYTLSAMDRRVESVAFTLRVDLGDSDRGQTLMRC